MHPMGANGGVGEGIRTGRHARVDPSRERELLLVNVGPLLLNKLRGRDGGQVTRQSRGRIRSSPSNADTWH